jgi:ubiquinone/menaquinone biosynthesis C-methylase UbiE
MRIAIVYGALKQKMPTDMFCFSKDLKHSNHLYTHRTQQLKHNKSVTWSRIDFFTLFTFTNKLIKQQKMNFIKQFLAKRIAKQLRKPFGILAGKVGNEMNKTNGYLYDFTIGEMKLKDNESILEIGFGNGNFFGKLFSVANNLKITGLDFSPEMVKTATAKNQSAVNTGKLTLRLGSSDKTPFPDNSFDKVFCINVIYFWEQPADHLKEIYRVLKPGGIFYTSIRTKESMAQLPFAKHGFTTYTKEEWTKMLEANHFHFVYAQKAKNEPDVTFNKQVYKLESLCIAAEKKK